MNTNNQSIFNKKILLPAVVGSFFKCNPLKMYKNPVMFCVLLVTILCTLILFNNILHSNIFLMTLRGKAPTRSV